MAKKLSSADPVPLYGAQSTMALLLTEPDIQSLMDMPALIDTLEMAQVEYSRGSAIQPMRSRVQIPEYPGALDLMPGYLPEGDALAVKVLTLRTDNPTLGLPVIHATVLLINPRDGRLQTIMAGGAVTAFRTAAVSGVATRHLAREDSRSLAIIGTGRQARTHLWAMASVRPIKRVTVFNRTRGNALAFKNEMEPRFQIPIEVAGSVKSAVDGADIIVLSTTTTRPVLFAKWLCHGVHINSIASATPQVRELDGAVIEKSKIVVDSKEAALKEAGDLLTPLAQGHITPAAIHGEVGEVAGGSKPGRTDDNEITVYKSVGLAIQDAAAAKWLFERARRLGYGLEVDL